MNERLDFIVNRLNCKELYLNKVWVRGESNHGTVNFCALDGKNFVDRVIVKYFLVLSDPTYVSGP